MDLTKTRSARRNTLYPVNVSKTKKKASNAEAVEVVKHFEPNPRKSGQTEELPFVLPDDVDADEEEEEEEDKKYVVEGIRFHPHRYHKAISQNTNKSPNARHPLKHNTIKNNNQDSAKKTNECSAILGQSAIQPVKNVHITRRPKQTSPTRNCTRSANTSPSRCRQNYEHTRPVRIHPAVKLKELKKDHNVVDRNNLSPRKLEKPSLNTETYTIKSKNNMNPPVVCCPNADNKPYSVVPASYIQNLRDEIKSQTCENHIVVKKTADELKSEIAKFRNAIRTDVMVGVQRSKDLPTLSNIHVDNPTDKDPYSDKTYEYVGGKQGNTKWKCTQSKDGDTASISKSPHNYKGTCGSAGYGTSSGSGAESTQKQGKNVDFDRESILLNIITPSEDENENRQNDENSSNLSSYVLCNCEPKCECHLGDASACSPADSSSKEDHSSLVIPKEYEECPMLPFLMEALNSSLCLRCLENWQESEQKSFKEVCTQSTAIEEDSEYIQMIYEQCKHIKTFTQTLTEAQFVLSNINRRFRDSEPMNNECCKINTRDVNDKNCKPTQPEYCNSVGIQVATEEMKDYSKRDVGTEISFVNLKDDSQNSSAVNYGELDNEGNLDKIGHEQDFVVKSSYTSIPDERVLSPITEKTEVSSSSSENNATCKCSNGTVVKVASSNASLVSTECKIDKDELLLKIDEDKSQQGESLKDVDIRNFLDRMFEIATEEKEEIEQVKETEKTTLNNLLKRTDSTSIKPSTERKLVIQMMPSIDIRRSLVTQKMPDIIITKNESFPQIKVTDKSNIVYEEVKHASSDISNKIDVQSTNNKHIETLEENKQIKEVQVGVNIPKSSTINDAISTHTVVIASSNCLCTNICNNMPITTDETTKNESNSDYSSIPSYDYEAKKFISQSCQNAQTKMNTETTYVNPSFNVVPNNSEEIVASTEPTLKDIMSGKFSRTVGHLARCQKDRVLKEFISELISQDPEAGNVLQSYQLLEEKSGHQPEEEVDEKELSYIDKDVYKTFVNPEGLKYIEQTETKGTNTDEVEKLNAITSTTTARFNPDLEDFKPCTYVRVVTRQSQDPCLEHSVQVKERIEVICHDKICGSTKQKDITSPADHDVTQENSAIKYELNRNSEVPKSQEKETNVISDSYMLHPPASSTMHAKTYANNFLKTNSHETISLHSNTTDDVIFEIDTVTRKQRLPEKLTPHLPKRNSSELVEDVLQGVISETNSVDSSSLEAGVSADEMNPLSKTVSQVSNDSEYVITHDISIQTSLSEMVLNSQQSMKSNESISEGVELLKEVVENDVVHQDEPNYSCCGKLPLHSKKKKFDDVYMKSSTIKNKPSSIFQHGTSSNQYYPEEVIPGQTSSDLTQRKSVKIEEPIIIDVQPLEEENNETLLFISALTNKNRSILSSSKSGSFSSKAGSDMKDNKSFTKDIDKTNEVTIMSINVEQPETVIKQSSNVFTFNRNVPKGDGVGYVEHLKVNSSTQYECENSQLSTDSQNYKDVSSHHHRKRKEKKIINQRNDTTSSSEMTEATTSKNISDEAELLSEGEVKCKCSASIGEVHLCPHIKNIKVKGKYLKRHPQNLLAHEFGDPNIKIKRQKAYYSNWVAYYISRSPSPDSDNSEYPDSSKDSSGLVKK